LFKYNFVIKNPGNVLTITKEFRCSQKLGFTGNRYAR